MNGCGENCTVEIIEVGNGNQLLSVSQALPPSWLSMKHFKSHCSFESYNGSQRFAARKEAMRNIEARLKYQGFNDTSVLSKQLFKLPFRCDDINIRGGYPGTGSQEQRWDVLDHKVSKKKTNDGSGRKRKKKVEVIGSVNFLTINLVAEEKVQMRKEKTPKKKKLKSVMAGSESDSSEDSESSEEEESDEESGISYEDDGNGDARMSSSQPDQAYSTPRDASSGQFSWSGTSL